MNGLAAQIVDVSGRIQLAGKATNTILQELKNQAQKADQRHAELIQKSLAQDRQLAQFDSRLSRVEQLLQALQTDLQSKDYSGRFNQLHETLRSSHLSLSENLQGHLLSGKSPCFVHMTHPFNVLIAFLPSYSHYRLQPAHGLLHLLVDRVPGGPRDLLRHLQASPGQHAQEVPLSVPFLFLPSPPTPCPT